MFVYLQFLLPYIKPLFSFLKKAVIVVIAFYIVTQLFFYFMGKDNIKFIDPAEQQKKIVYDLVNSPELNKTQDGRNYIKYYSFITCAVVGEACDKNPLSDKNGLHHTILGSISDAIALPFRSMPASGIYWVRDGLQNVGLVSHSYAAEGVGFTALQPFRQLWTVFRNLVFFLMILVMISIGFMIMFRAKINAQTVISVENALPKIVIAMILVTFSYAIAGFLIDLMYVVLGIIFALFKTTALDNISLTKLHDQAFFNSNGSLWGGFFDGSNNVWLVANTFYNFIPTEVRNIMDSVVTTFGLGLLMQVVGAASVGSFVGKGTGAASKILGSIAQWGKGLAPVFHIADKVEGSKTPIVALILSVVLTILTNILGSTLLGSFLSTLLITVILYISLVIIFFRIFFMFISAYIQVMLMVIFAPAMLVLEAIPGKSIFSTWFKGIAFNLATFPMFALLLLVSRTIMVTDTTSPIEVSLWAPPFVPDVGAQAFKTLVAGLLLFSSPELIKGFKQMLGYKPLPLSVNFGSFFSGVAAIGGSAFGFANQYHSLKGTLFGQQVGEGLFNDPDHGLKGPGKFLANFFPGVKKS